MARKYRAAVVGLGRMGSTFDDEIDQGGSVFLPYCHAPSYHAAPDVDLVAGADPHDEQRSIFGARWGLEDHHLYADYRDLLEKVKPDLLSVCTTARIRSQIVQDAARAGVKAIWAEKPIALTLAEADAMVETCADHGVALAINCARRWHPFFARAKTMIEEDELGEIVQVTGYGQCGLSHNGSHLIDIVRYMAGGRVEWVYGEMESDEAAAGEKDLMGNGYLAFDNDVRAYIRGMNCGISNWEIDVLGTMGPLPLDRERPGRRTDQTARRRLARQRRTCADSLSLARPQPRDGTCDRIGPGLGHRKRPSTEVFRERRAGSTGGGRRPPRISPPGADRRSISRWRTAAWVSFPRKYTGTTCPRACGVFKVEYISDDRGEEMKLGFVTYQIGRDWDVPAIIDMCGRTGFTGVELRTTHAHGVETELSSSKRRDVRRQFEDGRRGSRGTGHGLRVPRGRPGRSTSEYRRNVRIREAGGRPGMSGRQGEAERAADGKGRPGRKDPRTDRKSHRGMRGSGRRPRRPDPGRGARQGHAGTAAHAGHHGSRRSSQCAYLLELQLRRGRGRVHREKLSIAEPQDRPGPYHRDLPCRVSVARNCSACSMRTATTAIRSPRSPTVPNLND